MKKRKSHSPDLTSLLDVLFVVLFCVLINNVISNESNVAQKDKEIAELTKQVEELTDITEAAEDKKILSAISKGDFYTLNVTYENSRDKVYIKKGNTDKVLKAIDLPDNKQTEEREEISNSLYTYFSTIADKANNDTPLVIMYIYDSDISRRADVGDDGIITRAMDRLKKDYSGNISIITVTTLSEAENQP